MRWFYHLKTAVKLISAFVIIAMILAFVGIYGLVNMSKLSASIESMYNEQLIPIENLGQIETLYQTLRVNSQNLALAESQSEKDQYQAEMDQIMQNIDDTVSSYGKTITNAEEKQEFDRFAPAWQTYTKTLDQASQLSIDDKDAEFKSLFMGDLKTQGDSLNDILEQLISVNDEAAQQQNMDAKAAYAASRTTTVAIIAIALLVSIGFGYFISQIIARPLKQVVGLVGKVAGGDLRETSDIATKDEVGKLAKSINNMVLSLRQTVGGILASAESVSAASQQISASTEEIASGSTSQANSAQTMNELFKDLSTAINSVARSAEQASELSNQTMGIAEDGGRVLRTSIDGMNRVNEQMSRLEEDSSKIGEIIEVIDDIADQTNLLALNAAIEAARAGDQGRGFAVVADEVRKLAERSSEATKQITLIIKGMQENTRQSVKAVDEGVELSQKTGEAFENIMAMVNESAHKVAEIAAASEEQAAQSSEVLTSIESISAATEEAAASSEETASTAQSLAQLAEELNNSVAIFKID